MARAEFSDRHIGPSGDEISTMLLELGYSDLESFTQAVLPDSIKLTSKFGPLLPSSRSIVEISSLDGPICRSGNSARAMAERIGARLYLRPSKFASCSKFI